MINCARCVMQNATSIARRSYWHSESKELRRVNAQSFVTEKCRKSSSNGEDIRRSTQNTSVLRRGTSVSSNLLRRMPLPFLPPSSQGECRHHKSWRKQSVSQSEESLCSFPIRTSPPLFPFFTRDKESIEARIQWGESERRGPEAQRTDGKTSLHEAAETKGERREVYIAGSILHFAIPIVVLQRCIVSIAANSRSVSSRSIRFVALTSPSNCD